MVRNLTLIETFDKECERRGHTKGISLGQLINNGIPTPTHALVWGENIPKEIFKALENGESALLFNEDGEPYSILVMDCMGGIRERIL